MINIIGLIISLLFTIYFSYNVFIIDRGWTWHPKIPTPFGELSPTDLEKEATSTKNSYAAIKMEGGSLNMQGNTFKGFDQILDASNTDVSAKDNTVER